MLTVASDTHRLHFGHELKDGRLEPSVERPERADVILQAVQASNLGPIVPPHDLDEELLVRVHPRRYLDFLQSAHAAWCAAHGEGDALPLAWPVRGLRDLEPRDIDGRLGYYSFDAGTPIMAGTWSAAHAAAAIAATAADHVAAPAAGRGSHPAAAFALCRPPGHHAAADLYGGYCYLNNAAVAAETLLDRGAERVAILDVDYHHGNGTQSVFYGRRDVLFVSIHADPADEYPFFAGFADERGDGAGEDFTLNLPLPPGSDFAHYLAALERAEMTIAEFAPDALVVSLGVDTFAGDPLGRFRLSRDDLARIGAAIAGLRRPTVFVMEGGYPIADLGANVLAVLTAFADGHRG